MRVVFGLAVVVCLFATTARAQDELARGMREYQRREYAAAAVLLQRVVEGGTSDPEAGVQAAQFFLAKALVHLGFQHSALGVLHEITRNRGHAHHAQALPWLLQWIRKAAWPDDALELLSHYDAAAIDAAMRSLPATERAQLWYLRGDHAYRQGEPARAVALLSKVEPGSTEYLRARVLIGVSEVRRRRARPAIAAFKAVLRAAEGGDEDAQRLRELAWLSLGRVYYSAAHQPGRAREEGSLVGSAVDAWSRVDTESEFWLDALFESAWALYVANEHSRALGNIHALLSPYFRAAFYPEAHLLKAVIYYDSCQMDDAMNTLRRFHREYDPLRDELQELLARTGDWLPVLDDPSDRLSPRLAAVLQRALTGRELERARAEIEALVAQRSELEDADEVRASSLGQRIQRDLDVASALAQQRARELTHARAERLLADLQDVENQADTVEIEVLNYLRGHIGKPPNTPSAVGRSVQVDSEHVVWPFNGEYWRDELGYYRQALNSRCDAR